MERVVGAARVGLRRRAGLVVGELQVVERDRTGRAGLLAGGLDLARRHGALLALCRQARRRRVRD